MSKWTDFRNDIVKSLQVEEVTEQVKQDLTKQIVESIWCSSVVILIGYSGIE